MLRITRCSLAPGDGATKAVDLSFEADGGEAGALDMDFGGDADGDSAAIDLGADDGGDDDGLDFFIDESTLDDEPALDDAFDLDLEPTAESPTMEMSGTQKTVEMPSQDSTVETPTIDEPIGDLEGTSELPSEDSTVETPTIDEPIGDLEGASELPSEDSTVETPTIDEPIGDVEGTSELPSLDETLGQAITDSGLDSAATAEINLDDLDLGIDDLAETELASLDDLDATGTNEALSDDVFTDTGSVTGKNPEIDPNTTGVREGLDLGELFDLDATGEMRLAADETGRSPLLDVSLDSTEETEVSIDESLLDATGLTQVLSDDMAVETGADIGGMLADDEATMLASLDDDSDDFDFAKTEALPPDAFQDRELDETGEMPTMEASADDLDLDDLAAALKISDEGDTAEQLRDDATVEQPRPSISGQTAEVPTMSIGPEEMSDDLHDARTMTEVGTKLDLARAYVDMGDPAGARSILEEVLDEGDDGQRQQAQQLLDSLPS